MSAKCLGNIVFTIIGQYSYFESPKKKLFSFIKLAQFNDKLDNTIFSCLFTCVLYKMVRL